MTKTGAENNRKRHPGRGNRHTVDVPAPNKRERVPQPPPLRLQPAEHSSNLSLGPSADTAASGQARPPTSVQHHDRHHQRQQSRQRGSAGASGRRRQRAGRDGRHATRGSAAQAPGLLEAGEARDKHRHKLAAASDTPAGNNLGSSFGTARFRGPYAAGHRAPERWDHWARDALPDHREPVIRAERSRSMSVRGTSRLAPRIAREIVLLATRRGRLLVFDIDEIDAVAEHLAEVVSPAPANVGLLMRRNLPSSSVLPAIGSTRTPNDLVGCVWVMAPGPGCASML
jgi:hypothetical protein